MAAECCTNAMWNACQSLKPGLVLEAIMYYEEAFEYIRDRSCVCCDGLRHKKDYAKRLDKHICQLKKQLCAQQMNSVLLKQLQIEENTSGYSYSTIFGEYLDESVKEVLLHEPYLMQELQFSNLRAFVNLLTEQCNELKCINIVTKEASGMCGETQSEVFEELKDEMQCRNIYLKFSYDENLHDRKIMLSNGISILIGRGLHIYQSYNDCSEQLDYNFLFCLQTDIYIWRSLEFDQKVSKVPFETIQNKCENLHEFSDDDDDSDDDDYYDDSDDFGNNYDSDDSDDSDDFGYNYDSDDDSDDYY